MANDASDQELADGVKQTALALEKAIKAAQTAGLTVDVRIDKIDVTTWGDSLKSPVPVIVTTVNASVERIMRKKYV